MGQDHQLWAAVIAQAFADAAGQYIPGSPTKVQAERRRAREWLTEPNRDFDQVCTMAGLDPDAVRERAASTIRRQQHRDPLPSARKATKHPRRGGPMGKLITHDGVSLPISAWASRLGISNQAIRYRLSAGHPIERVLAPHALPNGPRPGVGRNFARTPRDRRGSVAQDCA